MIPSTSTGVDRGGPCAASGDAYPSAAATPTTTPTGRTAVSVMKKTVGGRSTVTPPLTPSSEPDDSRDMRVLSVGDGSRSFCVTLPGVTKRLAVVRAGTWYEARGAARTVFGEAIDVHLIDL